MSLKKPQEKSSPNEQKVPPPYLRSRSKSTYTTNTEVTETEQEEEEQEQQRPQRPQKQKHRTPKNPCPHEARAVFLDGNVIGLAETVLDMTTRVIELLERTTAINVGKCFTKENSSCLWNCLGHQSECDVEQHKAQRKKN